VKEKIDLILTIVSHRVVSAPTSHSLEKLRVFSKSDPAFPNYRVTHFIGDALISRARSQACTRFLEEWDAPYMIFIDDDILFEPQDVVKIYNHMVNGYDVIGGIYPVRGASQLSSYGWGGQLMVDGQVKDIEYLATGFMGISRRILVKVREELKLPLLNPNDWAKCYPFFEAKSFTDRSQGGDPIYISEDWDFCEKVRQIGGKIYTDTSVQLGHMREEIFTPGTVNANQMRNQMETDIYGAMNKQHELMLSVDTDLSEFLKIPLLKAQEKLTTAFDAMDKRWKGSKAIDDTEALFGIAQFNRDQRYFTDRLSQLLNINGLKILDIGCGIGTAVFTLAPHTNEVIGWDINPQCIEFCKYRRDKYELGGEFTTDQPDFSKFDLILAIDTLEHIDKLKLFLYNIGKDAKPESKLFHTDYFKEGNNSWPIRYPATQTQISKWIRQANYIEWDNRWAVHI